MRENKLALYVQLVWGTWDRLPLITADIERRLHRNIAEEAQRQGCEVLALNGMEDHIHLLVELPSTLNIAQVVKQVKGVSSHFANDALYPQRNFKWQGAYGAFTVSPWDLDRIVNYIKQQKEHHADHSLTPDLELSEITFASTVPAGGRSANGLEPRF